MLSAAAKGKEWQVLPRLLGCLSNQSLLINGNRTRSEEASNKSVLTTSTPQSAGEVPTVCMAGGSAICLGLRQSVLSSGRLPIVLCLWLLFSLRLSGFWRRVLGSWILWVISSFSHGWNVSFCSHGWDVSIIQSGAHQGGQPRQGTWRRTFPY